VAETEQASRTPAYAPAGTSSVTFIIKTEDPSYLPPSAAQVQRVVEMLSELRDDIREVESGPGQKKEAEGHDTGSPANRLRFDALAEQWRRESAHKATSLEMAMHPAYQQIIGMGRSALPLILEALARHPDHWFWALKAITCEDPVAEADRGDLNRMAQAWLVWGARNGYEF